MFQSKSMSFKLFSGFQLLAFAMSGVATAQSSVDNISFLNKKAAEFKSEANLFQNALNNCKKDKEKEVTNSGKDSIALQYKTSIEQKYRSLSSIHKELVTRHNMLDRKVIDMDKDLKALKEKIAKAEETFADHSAFTKFSQSVPVDITVRAKLTDPEAKGVGAEVWKAIDVVKNSNISIQYVTSSGDIRVAWPISVQENDRLRKLAKDKRDIIEREDRAVLEAVSMNAMNVAGNLETLEKASVTPEVKTLLSSGANQLIPKAKIEIISMSDPRTLGKRLNKARNANVNLGQAHQDLVDMAAQADFEYSRLKREEYTLEALRATPARERQSFVDVTIVTNKTVFDFEREMKNCLAISNEGKATKTRNKVVAERNALDMAAARHEAAEAAKAKADAETQEATEKN